LTGLPNRALLTDRLLQGLVGTQETVHIAERIL
jgi:hypothetical protein